MQHVRRIHFVHKPLRCDCITGHNRIRVMRTKTLDVL